MCQNIFIFLLASISLFFSPFLLGMKSKPLKYNHFSQKIIQEETPLGNAIWASQDPSKTDFAQAVKNAGFTPQNINKKVPALCKNTWHDFNGQSHFVHTRKLKTLAQFLLLGFHNRYKDHIESFYDANTRNIYNHSKINLDPKKAFWKLAPLLNNHDKAAAHYLLDVGSQDEDLIQLLYPLESHLIALDNVFQELSPECHQS